MPLELSANAVEVSRTVHFAPYVTANPYQPSLAASLVSLGWSVDTGTPLQEIARRSSPGPAVVHLHWLPPLTVRPRRLAGWVRFAQHLLLLRSRGIALVWTAHNLIPHESRREAADLWMSRTVARCADRVICHSDGARDEVVGRLRIRDPAKVKVIPHGHYIDAYTNVLPSDVCRKTLGLPRDATVFLSMGLIRPYKGVFDLMDAFRSVECANARLLVVGKPFNEMTDASVRQRAAMDTRVLYVPGYVPDDQVQLYMNASDVAVFPYRRSLTSGALILAMSFGRACIAPRLPATTDVIDDGGGLSFDVTSPGGLAGVLRAAIGRRSELLAMGRLNRARAECWDWNTIARATAVRYEEAMAIAGATRS